MENLEIRFMEKKDIEEVVEETAKVFHRKMNQIFSETVFLEDHRSRSLLAVYKDEIVGHIWIDKVQDVFLGKTQFYLRDIWVKEIFQRRGIGTEMLQRCAIIAGEENIDEIIFTSSNYRVAAHALYRKMNYNIKNTTVFIKEI